MATVSADAKWLRLRDDQFVSTIPRGSLSSVLVRVERAKTLLDDFAKQARLARPPRWPAPPRRGLLQRQAGCTRRPCRPSLTRRPRRLSLTRRPRPRRPRCRCPASSAPTPASARSRPTRPVIRSSALADLRATGSATRRTPGPATIPRRTALRVLLLALPRSGTRTPTPGSPARRAALRSRAHGR